MIRRIVCSTVIAFALAAPAAAGAATTFSFGRTGGNIEPFTVGFAASGVVTSTGFVQPKTTQLSPATRTRLAKLVRTTRFFTLPHVIRCSGALPDFASLFVTVRTASQSTTVLVHGDCSKPFAQLYRALATAAGLPS